MGNLSKSVIFDAARNKPRQFVTKVGLERRTERAPNGIVERWVDGQGNVVFAQLVQPASVRQGPEHVDAARAKLLRKGWVSYTRCPLTAGALKRSDFPEDKPELREYCEDGTYGKDNPCPHVRYVIKFRQDEQSAKMRQLEDQFFAEKRAKEAIEREKIAATDRLHDRIGQVLERVAETPPPKRGRDGG